MKNAPEHHEAEIIEQAMTVFMRQALSAKNKHSRIKSNMEARRRLEIKREEQRLQRELSDYDYN